MRIIFFIFVLVSTNFSSSFAAQIRGKVLDSKGAPLAKGLVIAADSTDFLPIETNAQGEFVLDNVTNDKALIFAAHGKDFAQGTAQDGFIELRLAQPGVFVPTMRQQFFEKFKRTIDGMLYAEQNWALLGSDKMLALALQRDEALTPGSVKIEEADWDKAGETTLQVLEKSAVRAPLWLRQNGGVLLEKIGGTGAARFNAEVAVASVFSLGDEVQRANAKKWLDEAVKQKDDPLDRVANVARWLHLAGIAGALGDARAREFTLRALTFADQAGKEAVDEWDVKWGAALALGGPPLFALLEAEWLDISYFNALGGAVEVLAPLDVQRARALLPAAQKLEEQVKAKEDAPDPPRRKFGSVAEIEDFIKTQEALSDPAKFWDKYENSGTFSVYWPELVARAAEKRGDLALALRALRFLKEQGKSGSGFGAVAALAERYDKQVAAEFWKIAETSALELIALRRDSKENVRLDDVADYCIHLAAFNPARARLLLETNWPRANTVQNKEEVYAGRLTLAAAMFALDPLRSHEMLLDSEAKYPDEALAGIMLYLMTDKAKR